MQTREAADIKAIRRSIVGGLMRRLAVLWAIVLIAVASVCAAEEAPRNVLLLNSYEREFEPLSYVAQVFRTEVSRHLAVPVHFVEISVQPTRSGEPLQERPILAYVQSLFPTRRPDLIVPIGGLAGRFAQQHRRELFSASPMLLTAMDQRFVNQAAFTGNETAVPLAVEPVQLIDNILQVLPETTTIAVVIGQGQVDKIWRDQFVRAFQPFAGRINVVWFDDLSFEDMRATAATLASHSAILYTALSVDANGVPYPENQTLQGLHAVTNAPIFGWHSNQLGQGIVGGSLIALEPIAQRAASVAVRILQGASPSDMMTPPQRAAEPIYDWRELQRWNIPEGRLPKGSIVRFRELSPWRRYFWYIVGVGSLCFVEAALILALQINRVRRVRAEQSTQDSQERFRSAMQHVASGLYTLDRRGAVTYVNPAAEAMLQWTTAEILGKTMHDVAHSKHPDGTVFPANECPVLRVLHSGIELREHEDVFIRKDGSFFPVVVSAAPLRKNGDTMGLVVGVRDDTHRREAERAIRESEGRFRLIANTAPVMIWMSDVDNQLTYVNQPWLDFTGWPPDVVPSHQWMGLIHPDDVERCRDAYVKAFDQREPFQVEHRLRRHDGEYRWTVSVGVPRYETDHSLTGYVGTAVDVTERKLAERALRQSHAALRDRTVELERRTTQLRQLTSDLTLAEQRAREQLARTLHDGLQQQLAVAALHLEQQMNRDSPSGTASAPLVRVKRELDEAITAARSLSVELSPPVLQSAGLPSALAWLADWTRRKYGLEVHVSANPLADSPRKDIRTLLFESVRELLFNVVKHAQVNQVTVDLTVDVNGNLRITVADRGVGFDPVELDKRVTNGQVGWGLFSIRERLTFLRGQFDIDSAPGSGTRFHLIAPSGVAEGDVGTESPLTPRIIGRAPGASAASVESARALKILIVDDHPGVREALRGLFQARSEFQIVGEAANGLEAIALAHALRPDVVLMDVSMPEMDGVEATRRIRAELPFIQILALTMYPRTEDRHAIELAGAECFFTKGVDTQRLINHLLIKHASLPSWLPR